MPSRENFEMPDFGSIDTTEGQDFGKLNSGRLLGSFLKPFRVGGENNKDKPLNSGIRFKSV